MKQDEMIVMLRRVIKDNQNYTTWTVSTPHIMQLVNNAIELEREACAKIAEEESKRGLPKEKPKGKRLETACTQIACGTLIAHTIRARGQE